MFFVSFLRFLVEYGLIRLSMSHIACSKMKSFNKCFFPIDIAFVDMMTQNYTSDPFSSIRFFVISQPVSHLYIVITHCIITIPTFLIVVLFLLNCYTVILFSYIYYKYA